MGAPIKIRAPTSLFTPVASSNESSSEMTKTGGLNEDSSFGGQVSQNGNCRRSNLSFDSITVPTETGKSQFSTRCDVVYKKILRDFRRSFIQDFNNSTNFMKNKRYKTSSFFTECLKEYLENKIQCRYRVNLKEFGLETEINAAIVTLGSLLYPKEMKKTSFGIDTVFNGDNEARTAYVMKFHDALYNFSMEKVSDSLENKFIALFLRLFIQDIHSRDKVQEIMSVFEASYTKALEILLKRVTEVLLDQPSSISAVKSQLSSPMTSPQLKSSSIISIPMSVAPAQPVHGF